MSLILKSLTLRRFRSIISSRLDFDNPTFLIGRNGAGKSNVVDALNFLADAASNPLEFAFDTRGGIETVRNKSGSGAGFPPNLGMRVELSGFVNRNPGSRKIDLGDYAFEIKAKTNGGFEVVRERLFLKFEDGEKLFYDRQPRKTTTSSLDFMTPSAWKDFPADTLMLPWLGSYPGIREVRRLLSSFHSFSIDPGSLRKPQEPDPGFELKSDGSNAGSVLRNLRKHQPHSLIQLCQRLAQITPYTSDIKAVKQGKQLTLEFIQSWGEKKQLKFPAHSASDGTLRALGILIAILQAKPGSLLIIEEPESSLHVAGLDALLESIQSAASSIQILVTTHSTDLLDAKWLKPENLRLVTWNGGTQIFPISNRAIKTLKSHLATAGELLRANALEEPFPLDQKKSGPQEYSLFPEHK